ncbi:MAG: PIG-L family deacetylase, partial [Chloroflexota bacterium]|nr:PIG-L family deacetylase [Chloroflexota bacterium]
MNSIPELSVPDLNQAKRILAVQPHYDDNDIAAGGTLHTLVLNGAELIYLTVTDDLAGVNTPDLSREQAVQRLHENQNRAAALIGVQHQIRLGFPDAGSYDYFLLREKIIDQIRCIKPDFLFTVDPWTPYETHNDHVQTGKAAAEAAILYHLPSLG